MVEKFFNEEIDSFEKEKEYLHKAYTQIDHEVFELKEEEHILKKLEKMIGKIEQAVNDYGGFLMNQYQKDPKSKVNMQNIATYKSAVKKKMDSFEKLLKACVDEFEKSFREQGGTHKVFDIISERFKKLKEEHFEQDGMVIQLFYKAHGGR